MAILIDMIDRPKRAFNEVLERPNAWVGPAILIIISMVVLAIVMASAQSRLATAMQAQFAAQAASGTAAAPSGQGAAPSGQQGAAPSGQQDTTGGQSGAAPSGQQGAVPSGQAAGGLPGTRRGTLPGLGTFPGAAGALTGTNGASLPITLGTSVGFLVLAWLVIGVLGYLLSRVFGGTARFGTLLAAGVWATVPFFFRNLTQLVYYFTTKRIITSLGLAFLAPAGQPMASNTIISSLLTGIDPFALWFYVLLAIGIGVVAHIKGWKAILITLLIVVVLAGIRLLPTLLNLGIRVPILG